MIYAPIIIPTLNRYEHLKRCVESLQNNAWAKYTELYISVDHPSREEHIIGYNKIMEFVHKIDGFAKTHIYIQKKNLGVGNNMEFLYEKVFEKYDRVIITEDDNEFSPCFIEYMDKGLELFENTDDIVFIGGYVYNRNWNAHGGNVLKLSAKCMHVLGVWERKFWQVKKEINRKLFDRIGRNPYYIWRLYHNSRNALWWYVHGYLCDKQEVMFDKYDEVSMIDITMNIYCIVKNKYVVAPVVSMVRDWGKDGSGAHCGDVTNDVSQDFYICEDRSFDYVVPTLFRMEKDNRIIQAELDSSLRFRDSAKVLQNWILRELLGYKKYHWLIQKQKEYRDKKRR